MTRRTKTIQLKLTQEEYDALKEGLEKKGVTLLQLLRKAFKLPEPQPLKGSQSWHEAKARDESDMG